MIFFLRFTGLSLSHSKLKPLNGCFTKNIIAQLSSYTPLLPRSRIGAINEPKYFVDYKEVEVYGGDGGDGCMSFAKIPRKEFAGPDGGDGGNGGHVIFIASNKKKSLNHLTSPVRGDRGVNGQSQNCHGAARDHTYIQVPMGTVISSMNRQELANLESDGDYHIAGRGGAGGRGNQFFLSNENRAPALAEKGGRGEHQRLRVELRTMANIGLIGFPNAGKSTLLRAITRAKPKVAAYPFTTRNPFVGIMEYSDHEQITVADIPGLIRGAHQNLGLGFSFLQHIQRCTCLLYVIDLSYTEPWTQYRALQFELEQYQKGLSARPNLIVANKVDLSVAENNLEALEAHVDLPVLAISADKGQGLESLMMQIRKLYEKHKSENKVNK